MSNLPSVSRWSVQQRNCARLLALGYSQTAAAEEIGVDGRTVRRWVATEGFNEYVDGLHRQLWEYIDPQFKANLLHALKLQSQVFAGERAYDDGAYLEARRFIERVIDRVGQLEPTQPVTHPTQVNVYTGGGDAA